MLGGKWRQTIHLEPPTGWLNDPNGLAFFDNNYHVYFQYCPSSPYGDTGKCWGHYVSPDLLSWHFTGTVLRPDCSDDRSGVYSGCAVTDGGLLHLFYTGNVKENGDFDYIYSGRGANVIHVTSADGHSMSAKQTLLRNADYPDFCSCHVRDPKVWFADGAWHMVLGARTRDDEGCVLFYKSLDLIDWVYEKTLSVPDFGFMWECPDCFKIDGHEFLSVSPQGLKHEELRFQNVYQSGYFRADNALCDFTEWDMGFDFYAPQTFQDHTGRRILIGWFGIVDADYSNPTAELGYQHCLTLPREITLDKDGSLLQNPVEELDALRKDCFNLDSGASAELAMPFEVLAKPSGDFNINIEGGLDIHYSKDSGIVSLEFSNPELGCGRTIRKAFTGDCSDLRLIVDVSSIELFINGGKVVMSSRFFPADESVSLELQGMNAQVFILDRMEVSIDGK